MAAVLGTPLRLFVHPVNQVIMSHLVKYHYYPPPSLLLQKTLSVCSNYSTGVLGLFVLATPKRPRLNGAFHAFHGFHVIDRTRKP